MKESLASVSATFPAFDKIIKRNGVHVPFDWTKISKAIAKAGAVTGEYGQEEADRLARKVLVVLAASVQEVPTVEGVQDIVEEVLISSPYRKAAKAYIVYREEHRKLREMTSAAQTKIIDSYLDNADWRVRENANMGYSLQGLNNHISTEITRKYWLEKLYSAEVRDAHESGDLHIHDLNLLAPYCVGWDLADLLRQGFRGVAGKVETKPPKHFRAALGISANFLYTMQGEAAGAMAFSNVDTLFAPFIAKDNLSYKEVRQAVQEWVYNLNVPTRVGFQTPFTNITLDVNCPAHLKDEAVIIGGIPQEETYGMFQREMDMFNEAFLEVMCAGDAKERVFTFPIPTINITKDFDYDDPRLKRLWDATGKYGIFYFANFVNSDMSPDDARSMCCRLRLDTRELRRRGGGLFGSSPLTGSIGVVTLNLPRLGYVSKDREEFLCRLERLMDIARGSLEAKRKVLERMTETKLYPYSAHYLSGVKERYGNYWAQHFSTIGLIGLDEACRNLLGEGLLGPNGREFGLSVMDRMRERISRYQEETGTQWNLEATPAEGTSYRLARSDREKFPGMPVFAGKDGEEIAYSNSSQPPFSAVDDPFALLDHQDEFQAKYTGGTVLHFWLGEAIDDVSTVKQFVKTVCSNYRLPYFTLTPTFSICGNHGYLKGNIPACPECGMETEVYSRIVGYMRPVAQWNSGKRREFDQRALFDGKLQL